MKKTLTITTLLFIIGCFQGCGTLQKIHNQVKENALKIAHQPKPVIVYLRDTVRLSRPPLTQQQALNLLSPYLQVSNIGFFKPQFDKIAKNQEIQAKNDISRTEDLHRLAGVVDKLVEDSRTRTENSKSVLDNQSIFAKMYAGTMKDNVVYRDTITKLQSQIIQAAKMNAAKNDGTTKSINILSGLMVIIALILGIPQILLRNQTKAIKKEVLALQLRHPC